MAHESGLDIVGAHDGASDKLMREERREHKEEARDCRWWLYEDCDDDGEGKKKKKDKKVKKARKNKDKSESDAESGRDDAKAGEALSHDVAAAAKAVSGQKQTVESTFGSEPLLSLDPKQAEKRRSELVETLKNRPAFDPKRNANAFHGRVYCGPTEAAKVLWRSDKKPRKDSPDWLTATEYGDTPAVFAAKIALLADLLCASKRTLAYTGAGLSVAAGIGMAAEGSTGQGGMGKSTASEPTLAHCVLAELNRQRLLHGWVQQNHDGLPQKAGYRQEEINEIHGSWFDPSNPVIKYSGFLRADLEEDLERQAWDADLVLVLGTSLTGLNADQCVTNPAKRSLSGAALGSVIISPQRTSQDGKASLRIFAKADEVMAALVKELGLGPGSLGRRPGIRCSADLFPEDCRVLVPYDENGVRSTSVKTWWDFSEGAKVRLGPNHNIDGAHQPNDKGIDDKTVGTVIARDEKTCSFHIRIGSTTKKLGLWWLETAKRGGVETLPMVNVNAHQRQPGHTSCTARHRKRSTSI